MPRINVGQIWEILPQLRVLVLATWAPARPGDDDVRVVPVSLADEARDNMADRDVRLTFDERGAHSEIVAHAWLSQTLTSDMFARLIGDVSSQDVEAAKNAELIGIVDACADIDAGRRGACIAASDDARLPAMRSLADLFLRRIVAARTDSAVRTWIRFEQRSPQMRVPMPSGPIPVAIPVAMTFVAVDRAEDESTSVLAHAA